MKIIVCIKQVPAVAHVEVDPETGSLKRLGAQTKTNPYDLYALEAALRLREEVGGTVTALTMGPQQAVEMMRDAYNMGVDEAVVLSDRKFAGSDVLATSYTIAQGVRVLGGADLIICGKQTTDGDTAQVGPAMAEHLGIPHAAWVTSIEGVDGRGIEVWQSLSGVRQRSEIGFPCLITVDKDINVPRLPSYRLKKANGDREVRVIGFEALPDQNLSRYGLVGSPTKVDEMFPPPAAASRQMIEGATPQDKADALYSLLVDKKLV